MSWFLPSIWRYRRPLGHVLLASLFVQLFALITPLFFQIVVDKVLVHKGMSTLIVVGIGMVSLGFFNVILQYLRTYVLSHTTNRIDVELGARLFHHLLHLPIPISRRAPRARRWRACASSRPSHLPHRAGPVSVIDLLFASIFIAVLFAYSWFLAIIVLSSVPIYLLIGVLIRPVLAREGSSRNSTAVPRASSFWSRAVVGMQTLKAAAVEPMMQASWEERLAAYVRTSFEATLLGGLRAERHPIYRRRSPPRSSSIFGAQAVIAGQMTVGELIAFNMIASQVAQPMLRLSQLFQDFQQVRISIERVGDILNSPDGAGAAEPAGVAAAPRRDRAAQISFRYRPACPSSLGCLAAIQAGEVIGIVGPSGSGKSTLTKLMQRLYMPERGQILIDGIDIAQVDPAWLRRQIGVVLQENLLFNRTIQENIALADPGDAARPGYPHGAIGGRARIHRRAPAGL